MSFFNTYIDAAGIICIPLIIAVFAFSLPLLLQIVARIDDKYSSTLLIKVFKEERLCKLFLFSMAVALVMVAIWMCQFESRIDVFIINNSALILLVLSSIF